MTQPPERQLMAILDLLGITMIEDAAKPGNRERILDRLYRVLDTLDSKTSHLLRFNSIIMTAMVFLATRILATPKAPPWSKTLLLGSVLVPLLGTLRALRVFKVQGDSFLRWRTDAASTANTENLETAILEEFQDLARICDERCKEHRLVWTLTCFSVCLLAIAVAAMMVWAWNGGFNDGTP